MSAAAASSSFDASTRPFSTTCFAASCMTLPTPRSEREPPVALPIRRTAGSPFRRRNFSIGTPNGGDDLRVARLVALSVRVRDRVHRHAAVSAETQLDLVGWRKAPAARLDVGGHAAPAQLSARGSLRPPGGESRPAGSFQCVGEHALEIAAVVGGAIRRLIRKPVL